MLLNFVCQVDMVDQCEKYVEKAKEELAEFKSMREYYVSGLQEFEFVHKYDCIWLQWVSNYLTDDDYVAFLAKARQSLAQDVSVIPFARNEPRDKESLWGLQK